MLNIILKNASFIRFSLTVLLQPKREKATAQRAPAQEISIFSLHKSRNPASLPFLSPALCKLELAHKI